MNSTAASQPPISPPMEGIIAFNSLSGIPIEDTLREVKKKNTFNSLSGILKQNELPLPGTEEEVRG